ncbi:MAG: extracellular solute-binding protein [Lachnospiraceae bacterium]|nr:extracellular solute-binding protein [Lachnospiraceae bacterium]
MGRKILALTGAVTVIALIFAGCGRKEPEKVLLSVWCPSDNVPMMTEMAEAFKELHADEAQISITVSEEEEISCKETVLANPKAAADVYIFAADQFEELWRNGALLPVSLHTEQIVEANGGEDGGAIRCATKDGTLYAYPVTASNGYFLYYNSRYFTEEDVKSFDRILEVAASNDKKAAMDFSSGWYIYSFFKGAGLDVEMRQDGLSNECNWNAVDAPVKGTDVAQAMLEIAGHKGFISCGDEAFINGVNDGSIIAGVNGTWNATKVEAAWGEEYAAAKLPEYTVAGKQVQMCSFAGYKLAGVNAYTQNPRWAMLFAEWITNEENQMKRFEMRGEGPSNVKAASEAVQASPAIAALGEQAEYGYLQNVADTFWTPTYLFGTTIAAGNPDGRDLQQLLDEMTEEITELPGEPESH